MLARQETKTVGAGCPQVDKGDILVNDADIFNFGSDLLLRDLAGATGFIRLQDNIRHRSVTAHQHMAAGLFLLSYPVIMLSYLLNFAGDDFCKALTTISVATTISKPQARAQTRLKKI
jgi:hypothetical protein